MTVTLTVSALPSASFTTRFRASGSGFPNYSNLYLAWGIKSGAAPTTYGDVSSGVIRQIVYADIMTLNRSPGVEQWTLETDVDSIGAATNQLWFMLFNGSPSGASVPLVVAGPYIVNP